MCGITGMLAPGANPQTLLERTRGAAARLTHRGPDDEGFLSDGPLALGHRRLVVIDRAGGAQPFTDFEKRVSAVYNGELYNHRELRKELESEGERFHTRSDTEVLVRAFARWGEAAFGKFEGMFAAALWHHGEKTLTLARDGAGEKPLFYFDGALAGGRGTAFSSEVFSLLALLDEVPPVDPVGLWSYLTLGYARAPRLLRGIAQLPPGSFRVYRGSAVVKDASYWRPKAGPAPLSEKDALPAIREAVHRAVASRLESDVPLGAFLSGGVDSTIVCYEMRKAGVADLSTFSIGFSDGVGYDESPWARRVAKTLGTKHHEHVVVADEGLLEAVMNALDEPMADSSAIAVWPLAAHARANITVALGGDGGDEIFCGYERFAGVQLSGKLPGFLRRALPPLAALVPDTQGYGNRGSRLRRVLREAPRAPVERLLAWQSLAPPENTLWLLNEAARPVDRPFPWPVDTRGGTGSRLHDALKANYESYLPDDLLVKTDRMSMAHGLELRAPFLDRALAELGLSLPVKGLLRGLALKRWLKRAYEGTIDPEILHRRKHGFGVPIDVWLRGRLRPWARERLLDEKAPVYEHLDREAVLALWEAHVSEQVGAGQRLYGILLLDHWLRRVKHEL